MADKKTVKHHVPHAGIYLYARMQGDKHEMIILNSTDKVQTLDNNHYNTITGDHSYGVIVTSGERVDFSQHISLDAREKLIIEF